MLKQLFLSLAVVGLTACGTGSEDSKRGGTGECMSVGQAKAGAKSKLKTLHYENGVLVATTFLNEELIDINNKSSIATTRTEGPAVNVKVKFETEHYIKNHYIYVTQVTTTNGNGQKLIGEYKPHGPSSPWDRVCKGETWEDTFSFYLNSKLVEKDRTVKRKIEKINVPKTVESGTYNTYIIVFYGDDDAVTNRTWFDMETSKLVYSEDYDDAGKISQKRELIEYTY